jgi:DNA-binding FrmR family transcriptional regulator
LDILNQIAAARSALDALGVELLTGHLESCVVGHGTDSEHEHARPMTQEQLLDEVRTALSRFLK